MTRREFRKKCRAEKIRGYRLLRAGEIIAAIAMVLLPLGLLAGDLPGLGWNTEILLLLLGLLLALTGAVLSLVGEAVAGKAVKAASPGIAQSRSPRGRRSKKWTLENQYGKIEKFSDADIENYLEDMFLTPEQFVVLDAPRARSHVRFVQACRQDERILVQLGLEGEEVKLVEKLCSEEECKEIFLAFYKGEFVPKRHEYRPVSL